MTLVESAWLFLALGAVYMLLLVESIWSSTCFWAKASIWTVCAPVYGQRPSWWPRASLGEMDSWPRWIWQMLR